MCVCVHVKEAGMYMCMSMYIRKHMCKVRCTETLWLLKRSGLGIWGVNRSLQSLKV